MTSPEHTIRRIEKDGPRMKIRAYSRGYEAPDLPDPDRLPCLPRICKLIAVCGIAGFFCTLFGWVGDGSAADLERGFISFLFAQLPLLLMFVRREMKRWTKF